MALAIKLLVRGKVFTSAQTDDKQVCISSSDDDAAQDLVDFKDALNLTPSDVAVNVTTVTGTTHTVALTDNVLLVDDDTAGGAVTLTLPAAATAGEGRTVYVKKLGTTGNVVIDGNASETVDGGANATLTIQYEAVMLVCSGEAWYVF